MRGQQAGTGLPLRPHSSRRHLAALLAALALPVLVPAAASTQTLLPDGVNPGGVAVAGANGPAPAAAVPQAAGGLPGAAAATGGNADLSGGGDLRAALAELGDSQEGMAALLGALTGTPEGLQQLGDWLDSAEADPEEVADKTERLLAALAAGDFGQDAALLQEAILRIERAATGAVLAIPVLKTIVTPDFEIDERRIGYDFGPPDGEVMRGFRRVEVTEAAFRREDGQPQNLQAVRGPTGDPLLADGVVGVEQVTLPAPNGRWRVVILANDFGDPQRYGSPFGEVIEVNGVELRIANAAPDQWMDSIALTNARGTDVQAGDFDFIDPNLRGGAIVVETIVSGGSLTIRFRPRQGRPTLLSGIVLEPADAEDSILRPRTESVALLLASSQEAQRALRERRQQAEARIQDAVARLLTQVATAAGTQQQRDVAALLGPPDPVVDRGTRISAN